MKIYEDNSGTIDVVKNGYSPALRHLLKTQKCSIDLLHQIIHVLELGDLCKIETDKQAADIFTKALSGPKWDEAFKMLNFERGVVNKAAYQTSLK